MMVQPIASPALAARRTTSRFKTGRLPGSPMQTGQHWVFGGAPNWVGQLQKIFDLVRSSAWTSSPITIS